MSAEAPARLHVGSRIGTDLTVLGTVDDGGTEPVYLVWHGQAWCGMACKLSRSARHARREAALLRRFAHPNIVRFLGAGEPPHILMEFLEGPTLLQLIRSGRHGRLPVADALRAAIHVGAALVHVHEHGYLHLDVKPSNVIVGRGRPVLFDFGSARRRGRGRPRSIIGTDEYMAPEQCRRGQLTPATDVFGLGATLYEMLTGRLPFAKGDARSPFPQCTAVPRPPRAFRRDVSGELERLVLACLARDPRDRPGSPAALLPELHRHITCGPSMWPGGFDPRDAAGPDIGPAGAAATLGEAPRRMIGSDASGWA
jgi:serine/threonine protein kinase